MIRILITFLIWLLIQAPLTLIGFVAIPIMLLLGWQGYSTLWGNAKYGRGNVIPYSTGKKGFWAAYNWLAFRNPTNNLCSKWLAVPARADYYSWLTGDKDIGEKKKGGYYCIEMPGSWEYYWIYPYTKTRCIRFRCGWRILGRIENGKCSFCFSVNPFKAYSGI